MIRQSKSGTNSGVKAMTVREAQLREFGVVIGPGATAGSFLGPLPDPLLADSHFSGYGVCRPMTVRSYSLPEDANLERDQ